jgi:hypothetical protein
MRIPLHVEEELPSLTSGYLLDLLKTNLELERPYDCQTIHKMPYKVDLFVIEDVLYQQED